MRHDQRKIGRLVWIYNTWYENLGFFFFSSTPSSLHISYTSRYNTHLPKPLPLQLNHQPQTPLTQTTKMQFPTSTILSLTTLLALSTATPIVARQDGNSYAITIDVVTSYGLDPNVVSEPLVVELNTLTLCNSTETPCSASKLIIEPGSATGGIREDRIECRGYKDCEGVQPGSAPFNSTLPASLSTNLGTIGSILCYLVGEDEISG
jgi:hypothetical protein